MLASPAVASLAERAGLVGGEWVSEAAAADAEPTRVGSFEDLRWRLTQAALSGEDMTLWVAQEQGGSTRPVTLALSELDVREADARLFQRIGITGPWTSPVMGDVMDGGAAAAAGLRAGDVVKSVDGQPVGDGQLPPTSTFNSPSAIETLRT